MPLPDIYGQASEIGPEYFQKHRQSFAQAESDRPRRRVRRNRILFSVGRIRYGHTTLIDNDGETALHKITLNYSNLEKIEKMEKIAKMLIKAGCDLTTRNENGETFIDKLKRRDCNELATKIEEWIKDQT